MCTNDFIYIQNRGEPPLADFQSKLIANQASEARKCRFYFSVNESLNRNRLWDSEGQFWKTSLQEITKWYRFTRSDQKLNFTLKIPASENTARMEHHAGGFINDEERFKRLKRFFWLQVKDYMWME